MYNEVQSIVIHHLVRLIFSMTPIVFIQICPDMCHIIEHV
jgi:hypothetical protein